MSIEIQSKRRVPGAVLIVLVAAALCGAALAGDTDLPPRDPEANADTTEAEQPPSVALEESVEVRREAPRHDSTFVTRDELEAARIHNLSQALETLPGVSGVRRNQNYLEPVVRGMGWERVQTQLNGLPLHGACPGRMDPPACVVSGSSVQHADVVKGLASVTHGPAGTGGRLEISTDYDRGPSADRELRPWLRSTFDDSRDGYSLAAGAEGGTESFDVRFGAEYLDHEDYESPKGVEVPALHEETGGFASLGWRIDDQQRVNAGFVIRDEGRTDYPSLPMDTDDTTSELFNLGWSIDRTSGALRGIDIRSGYADVEHVMSNRYKPNRMMMEAETLGTADSAALGVTTYWQAGPAVTVAAGLDYSSLDRDALRSRRIVMSGAVFLDHLWPDVSQRDLGLFAEATMKSRGGWQFRLGARFDSVDSDAAAADDPALGGMTIREAYVSYYGDPAADVDRRESLVSGNLLVSRQLNRAWRVQGGAGIAQRAASMTERFFAFAPAPNGFVVGNPSLGAETKFETSIGATHSGAHASTSLTVFHYDVDDYIYHNVLELRDVNGDGIEDTVRGFSNVDATMIGGELSSLIRPANRWILPVTISWVRGENDLTGNPLPEIPALEATVAARYLMEGRLPGSIELGGRFVNRQDRIDPTFGEDATPGYSVWHLRGIIRFADAYQVELGIENLTDKEYNEHLNREAVLTVGGLLRGDEIPQPARSIHLAIRATF